MGGHRRRVEPTDEWEQTELLCGWPEQREYEIVRPLVLFGSSAAQRAAETGAGSERSDPRSGRPGGTAPHSSGVAAASASTRANNSGRESIGWWSVGISTTLPALLAYSRCASGGVARSSAHTT